MNLEKRVHLALKPWTRWNELLSFAVKGRAGEFYAVETVTHELGHLLHLRPQELKLLDTDSSSGLARVIVQMSPRRAFQNEVQARATNYLISRSGPANIGALEWLRPLFPVGACQPNRKQILAQARVLETQVVAGQVWQILKENRLI